MTKTAPPAPRVLCVLYPAMGHLLPVLPVLTELVSRGCEVVATITPELADRVRETGAEVVTYPNPMVARLPDFTTHDKLAERMEVLLREIVETSPTIERAFSEPPDVVVHDLSMSAPGRVLAAQWGRPNVRMLPIFASNEHFSIDEKFAMLAPPPEPGAPPHPAFLRYNAFLTDYVHDHGFEGDEAGEVLDGRDELNIVFLPKEFQIAGETFGEDHVFVGPSVTEPADEWTPPEDGSPVALISMGTTSANYGPEFFTACARAFEKSPWHVVIALGSMIDPAELGPLPDNVEMHRWIPIGAVLRHASAYICQGGISGVMESLHHGTPMVLIPHQPEQVTNAQRVEELGLGLVLTEADVTPELVRQAVDQLLSTEDIAERLAWAQDVGRRAGGAQRAAEEICARARG